MNTVNQLFKKIEPTSIEDNFINIIGEKWMLITAGTPEKFNTMTASWGAMVYFGISPLPSALSAPTRHTFNFANNHEIFTLSFLDEKDRRILNYCGSHSGKNVNKIEATGLKP
jgi:flavin reductase (DIM6/NTAB) family NADH-FMN oxidoreductase RutF